MLNDLMKTLDASLASASNRLSFVVTELPQSDEHMARLLDGAILAAHRHRMPLVEIQIGMARFPAMGATYWHVPVSDSGDPDLIRLVFDPSQSQQAA
jgi:hypothetical protein